MILPLVLVGGIRWVDVAYTGMKRSYWSLFERISQYHLNIPHPHIHLIRHGHTLYLLSALANRARAHSL